MIEIDTNVTEAIPFPVAAVIELDLLQKYAHVRDVAFLCRTCVPKKKNIFASVWFRCHILKASVALPAATVRLLFTFIQSHRKLQVRYCQYCPRVIFIMYRRTDKVLIIEQREQRR